MENINATAVFFSPTDTSRTGVCAIARALSSEFSELDLTCAPAQATFGEKEVVVFGAPVYGGRIPAVCRERMAGLKGNNTPCIITVTYGNRDFDDALLELNDLVQEQGFVPVAAAALVGQHTYGTIQVGRPDENDQAQDATFAAQVAEKLQAGNWQVPAIPGNRPYKDGGKGGNFRPLTSDACVSCGLCVRGCPTKAIADDCRTIDDSKCIACFRCIRRCPVGAKNMDTPEYNAFAAMFSERLKDRKENQYFL